MATFHLVSFGCRASQADGAALKQQLLQAGLEESRSIEQSHIAVLNTCTVTAVADAEVRQVVRRIHRLNPNCRILVTGCYAQRAPGEIAELAGVTWIVGNSHKHAVADLLGRQVLSKGWVETCPHPAPRDSGAGFVQIEQPHPAPAHAARAQVLVGEISDEFHFAPVFPDDRTRPTLKIQDGCNARCSFCVIPYVRGRSRSLMPEKVIEQILELSAKGYREIVLSGINLGSYGKDLDRRLTFLGLLERILAETSIPRLRISSVEPMDVGPELIRLVARETRLAQHFHVPLQSGCDRILRQMNRRYWTSQYAERIFAIREEVPNCGIGADIMVGFPGETDREHAMSARFIESLPFTYLHIFPYSARPLTPAAALPHAVNGRVARERGQEIRSLIQTKRRAFLLAQVGRTLSALALDDVSEGGRVALSSNYLKLALPGSNVAPNTLLDVRVGRVAEGMLYGTPKSYLESSHPLHGIRPSRTAGPSQV